ncbi:hypothetical protein MASR2M18_11560 [Ignavibacteria bacterium]|nr:regulatory protein RecX [Bacteroidota bacterium]MCZ2132634.1 RecX family transcriptional regulator [Bacteroidota bacterium]
MPIVTSIVKKRGRAAGCIVMLDGGETFECSTDLIVKYNVSKKQDISEETVASIARDQRVMSAKQLAHNFVAFKPRTSAQVRKKLIEKDFLPDEADEAVEFLKEFKYINDTAYARSFISDLLKRKSMGKSRIVAELKKRGIPSEDIKTAVAEVFPEDDAQTMARDAATKKLRTVRHKTVDKQRSAIVSFLAQQGFAWDIIRKVVEELKLN